MGLYSSPPPLLSFTETKPTLLVCWWITIFCFVIVLLRLAGRYIRSELLYVEDRVVSYAIIPLFLRMGFVHVVLLFGTNNAQYDGVVLSARDRHRIAIGSGLVLASRICHAATLWIYKIAILEYFKRISDALSERYIDIAVLFIRLSLALSFVAVLISDLTECHPFSHYWQVLPDPGGHCRQGYAQLLTVSVCNAFTDLLLVLFPVSFILLSSQSVKRKIQLILLFSLSLGVVGVTVYRATRVIEQHGSQRLRSLVASVELLFATAAANALVLGSFVRDRGAKRNKFRPPSITNSLHPSSTTRSRRPTMVRHWGSDEDLVRDLGLGVQPSLRDDPDLYLDSPSARPLGSARGRPAPIVKVDSIDEEAVAESKDGLDETRSLRGGGGGGGGMDHATASADLAAWKFPEARRRSGATNSGQSAQSRFSGHSDDDSLLYRDRDRDRDRDRGGDLLTRTNSTFTPRKVSFVDAGGLLRGGAGSGPGDDAAATNSHGHNGSADSDDEFSPTPLASPHQSYLSGFRPPASPQHVFPSPAYTASTHGLQRGSTAVLQDLSGFLATTGPPAPHMPSALQDLGSFLATTGPPAPHMSAAQQDLSSFLATTGPPAPHMPSAQPPPHAPSRHTGPQDLPYQGMPPASSLSPDGTLLTRQGSLGNPEDMLLMDAGGLLGGSK